MITAADIMRVTPALVDVAVQERDTVIQPGDGPYSEGFSEILYNSAGFMAVCRGLAIEFQIDDPEGIATVGAAMTLGVHIGHQIAIEQMRHAGEPS